MHPRCKQILIFIFGAAVGANFTLFLFWSKSIQIVLDSKQYMSKLSKPTLSPKELSLRTSPPRKFSASTSLPPKLGSPFYKRKCPALYGRVALLHLYTDNAYANRTVWNAMQSMRCYVQMRGYSLYEFIDDIGSLGHECEKMKKNFLAQRHCLTAQLLLKYDYVIFIDGDSGVINPYRCFEEYINPNVSLHFLPRLRTGEVQSGHYIAKNTSFSRKFLLELAREIYIKNNEQPAIHNGIYRTVLNDTERQACLKVKQRYWLYVGCIVGSIRKRSNALGDKVQIYSRGQSFVRDAEASDFFWSHSDFLLHALKPHYDDMYGRHADDVMFNRRLRDSDCNNHMWLIPYNQRYIVNQTRMDNIWREFEGQWQRKWGRKFALLQDISSCWPTCSHAVV